VAQLFANVYEDQARAEAYAQLGFPGTYFLAFRDLPRLLQEHVRGRAALDFGCGTGRSTRFLGGLGYTSLGVDISEPMLARARQLDPQGEYRLMGEADVSALPATAYDLILSTFTFDNIPTLDQKLALLMALQPRLKPAGRLVNLVSTPDIYVNEWVSFSTRDFPENRAVESGGRVRIVMLDVDDRRPVEDVVCSDQAYRRLYAAAGLQVVARHLPLGTAADGIEWVSETTIAPWAIYVLAPSANADAAAAV